MVIWAREDHDRHSRRPLPQGQVEGRRTQPDLKEFVSEALQEKLAPRGSTARSAEPEWMQAFGKLRHLQKETARIQERIHDAFEVVEPEDRS
jgi:hypothetical protein